MRVPAQRADLDRQRVGVGRRDLREGTFVPQYGVDRRQIEVQGTQRPDQPQPYDRGLIKAIEKAIQSSDLGLAPNTDGAVIRLNIPALNEERRRDLVKVLHKKVEDGRVEIRTLRRHTHEEMRAKEKSSGVSTDDVKRLEAQLQKLTDRYILMADEIGAAKEKEILAV